jgi:putative transposase
LPHSGHSSTSATDLTTAWTRRDGVVAITPVLDCGDRVALECDVTKSQEAGALLAPMERSLIKQFDDPERVPEGLELRSDHGPHYTDADCRDLCDHWGIDHTFAPVGRPTGNAVAERFIQTRKIELVWTRDWESLEELRGAINEWLERYNGDRPHQSLDWMTPNEKRASNLGLRLEAAA